MRIKSFITSVFAGLALFVSCDEPNTDLGAPALTLVESEITIDQAGGEAVITLSSTRDWMAASDGEWLVVTPESGSASTDPQTVTVTALENTGMDREATVTFTIGMINRYLTVKQPGLGGSTDQLIIYSNNFDKEEATKTYGSSGGSWPYLDQFDGWKNETGTGVANIEYAFKGMSARANSTSNSNYSDYEGSGLNNMFFGSNAYLAIKNIALNGTRNIAISFGTEKYSQDNGSIFTPSEFHIWLSQDGVKWVEFTDYVFAGGQTEGRWNIASGAFTLPEGTANLSICMAVDVASSYRMDDLNLLVSSEAGTAVDFSNAQEIDFNEGGNTGGGGGGNNPNPNPDNIIDVTVAEFLAAAPSETVWYRLKGEVVGPINEQYGNFDIKDATGQVYVYGISNWSQFDVKEGGTITIVGNRYVYNETKDEVMNAYIEAYDPSTETGDNGSGDDNGDDPAPSTGKYEPQNITWTLGSSAYDNTSGSNAQTAVVNGETVNNLLKLGTGSKVGDATLHVPAGTKKIGAYILAWKGKSANVKFSVVGGSEIKTVSPAANDGASNNPPYTITVTSSDYYEIEVNATSAMDVKVETVDSSEGTKNARALLIGLKSITE